MEDFDELKETQSLAERSSNDKRAQTTVVWFSECRAGSTSESIYGVLKRCECTKLNLLRKQKRAKDL